MRTTMPTYRSLHWSLLLGTALLGTLFLYFIDEGRYSLEDLNTTGNLIAMSFYFVGLTVGLFTVSALFANRTPGATRTALVLGLGTLLGFVFGLLLMLALGLLQSF
ncbi:MAG: hypothetical protein IT229_12485 [Flavobacteriales bacterium]|nr:hypothetical protein [Flavobacteriales bacterium]